MKIAILAPEFLPTWGGVGIYTVNLVKELSKENNLDVHVITPKRGNDYNKEFVLNEFDNKITIHNFSVANDYFVYNFKFQLALLKEFTKLHKKYKFDLVHSMNLVHMPDIFLKFRKWDIPFLTTVHTTIDSQFDYDQKPSFFELKPIEYLSKLTYPYIKLMQNKYVSSTEHFICVSNYVASFLPQNKNITIINNGLDVKKFKPGHNGEFSFLDNLNMPKILFSGRLLYMKGIDTLIKVAREVLKDREAHFIFAGSGNIKKWQKKFYMIAPKYYNFLDYVPYERIHNLYQKCDIFVLPSFTESFPYTILEAMSTSLPVIATKVGGVSELIYEGKTGLLVPPGDVDALKEKIVQLLDNKELRIQLGKNARRDVESKFTVAIMAEKTKQVYYNILGE